MVVGLLLTCDDSDFEEELQGLTSSLDLLATLLTHYPHSYGQVKPLVERIFSECARKVLGVEFQKLKEDDDQRASFMAAVEALCTPTQEAGIRRLFLALQWTLENCWAHPTLVSMMKGEEIVEAKALHYLEKLELPEVFRLRIELLVESGCDQYALNLCNWCVRSTLYRQDVFVRQTQLLLLHKFGKLQDFYNQCWQVECCTAARLLQTTFNLAHVSTPSPSDDPCWTLECCVGVRMVECLLEDEDKRAVCLTLAQTFLLQDWMQPEKKCCTRELLRLWMHAQRLSESDNEEFLSSVSKVAQITRVPTQLVLLIEVMQTQFGSEFLSFCTELALRALKLDRHRLDSARVKKEDEEADSAADGLASTCRQVSQLYQDHNHMCLSSLLTALYLDPKPDLFFAIESKMEESGRKSPPRVPNVDAAMFKELLDLVEGLRPSVLHPKHGWKEIKKIALFHLENTGYSYDSAKNAFTNLEELLIKKRQTTRKKSKSKTTKQKCFRQFVPKLEASDVKKDELKGELDPSDPLQVSILQVSEEQDSEPLLENSYIFKDETNNSELVENVLAEPNSYALVQPAESQQLVSSSAYPVEEVPYVTMQVDGSQGSYDEATAVSSVDPSTEEPSSVLQVVKDTEEQTTLPQNASLEVNTQSPEHPELNQTQPSVPQNSTEAEIDSSTDVEASPETSVATPDTTVLTNETAARSESEDANEAAKAKTQASAEAPTAKSLITEGETRGEVTSEGQEVADNQAAAAATEVNKTPDSDAAPVGSADTTGQAETINKRETPDVGGSENETSQAQVHGVDTLTYVKPAIEGDFSDGAQVLQSQEMVELSTAVLPEEYIQAPEELNAVASDTVIDTHYSEQLESEAYLSEAEVVTSEEQVVGPSEVSITLEEPQKVIVCPAEVTVLEGRAVLIGDEMTVETEIESSTLQNDEDSQVQEAVDEIEVSTELSPDSKNRHSFNGQFGDSPLDSPRSGSTSDEEEEVLFSCAYCSKPFNTMAQRRRHQEWLCSLKVAKYSCQKCGRTYQSERSLYKHIRVAHRLSVEDILKNVKLPPDLLLKPCSVSLERLGTAILDRYNITIKVKKKKPQPKALGANGLGQEKMDSLKTIKKEKKTNRPGDSPTKRPARRIKPVKKLGQEDEQILVDGLVVPQQFTSLDNRYQEVLQEEVLEVPYIQSPITDTYSQLQVTTPQQLTPHIISPIAQHQELPQNIKVITSIQLRQPMTAEMLAAHTGPQRNQTMVSPRSHVPGTPRDHSCRYCREKYTNERARLKHERDCEANPHSTEEVICEFCGGIYKGLLSLNSHLLARHTPDAPKGDKEEHSYGVLDTQNDSPDAAQQKRMAPKKKLKLYKNIFVYMIIEIHCGSCDSIFGDKNYCRQHQRKSCSEENGMRKVVKYCCKYCEQAFTTMNNCYQHCLKCDKCPTGDPVKDAETSIYKCTEKECKRAFISQVSLKAHILSVHYIRGNATNVRFTPGASSKSRAKKQQQQTPKKPEGSTTNQSTTEQATISDINSQANFNLAGLSAAEFEQAINMPNVDGFLKLLEDDTLIDSHWDLSEPFQGQNQAAQGQSESHSEATTQSQTTTVVTAVVTQASATGGSLPPLPSWVKTTARTQWNTVAVGSHNTQPVTQPQLLQVAQIPHHLKPTLVQAAPGIATARLTAPQAQLLQDKRAKLKPQGQMLTQAQAQLLTQAALRPTAKPRPKPKTPQPYPEPSTPSTTSPSDRQDDDDFDDDTPRKKQHFGGRQPWIVNGKKFMTYRNAPMLRTAIHMCKKCHSKFEDEQEGKNHVEKCGDKKNILIKTRRFYCVYCDHVSESAKKCRDHLVKTCLPAMNIDPGTVLNPRYECKEDRCDKAFFVRFFLVKHMVNDHGRDKEEFRSKKKDMDDFSLPAELNERLPDYIKECLPLEFTKRRKEGKEIVSQQRRKQRKESDSTTYTESSEVSQMSIGSSGQATYPESSTPSGTGSMQNLADHLKDDESLEQQYMMQVTGENNNTALVAAPMVAQYVQMSTVNDEEGVVQNVGALLLQCATSEGVQIPSMGSPSSTSDAKMPRLLDATRRNSQGDIEAIGQAIEQGAHDVSNALQNAQQGLQLKSPKNQKPNEAIKAKLPEDFIKLSQQQSVWASRNKNAVPVMSISGNHIQHISSSATSKGVLTAALAGQVHLQRGTQSTTLMPPVVMTTHVTGGNIARPQAVRPMLISPQAPSTPASSQISESVDSESSQSPSPEPLPEPEDGRISPVVDALLARIKAKTKKLEEKNRLKAANKQKMNAAAKRRKRDSSGSVQSAMSPGASSVSSVPSSVPAPSPGQTPTPPLPQPGSLTAQTIFNHIQPPSPDSDKCKEELRCEECDLAFNTKSLLTYHQKYSCAAKFGSHNKMDDKVCRYCKTTFHHKVALKYHIGKCRSMMLENASQPSTLSTVEEDCVEAISDRDSTLNSPTPKKKPCLIESDQSRENLMKTLERKAMCHADVNNPMSPRNEWTFKCKYCSEDFGQKLMSLHSHVVASHPETYKKFRLAKDHDIKLLQAQNSINSSLTELANADDLSLLSLDTSNDLALISDLALLTAEMEASKGSFSKLSSVDDDKKLVCDLCENEREFEKESSYLYHLKCVHGKDLPRLDLRCPQCKGLTFDNDITLHKHMKAKHGIDSLLMPGKLPFNLRQAGHLESQVYHVQGQIFQNQNNQQQGQGDQSGQGQSEQVTTVDTSQIQTVSSVGQSQAPEGQALPAAQLVMTSMSADQVTSPALVSSGGLTYTSMPLSSTLAGSGIPVLGLNSLSMTVPTTSVTLQTADGQIIHTSVPTSLLQDGGLSALSGAQVLPTGELALPLITAPGQQLLLQTVASGQVLLSHAASPHHGQSSPALTAASSQASPAQPKKKPMKKKKEDDGNDDKAKKKRSTPAKPRPSPSGTGASFKPELDPEKWKCRYCDMGFPRRQDMRDHIKYTHRVPGAYPGPLPTKSSTIVKGRDDDGDPHEAVLRQGTDILQQALSMIGEAPSGDAGDSLASTGDSVTGSNIVIQQHSDGQILATPLDIPVSMDFDMVQTMDNTGHQNMTVLPIQQLGLVSAASTIDPSLLLQAGVTISAQISQPTSTVSVAHYSQSGQETEMEAEINDVLRQASMAAGIFEDEPGDNGNNEESQESGTETEPKPCHYSATEQEEPAQADSSLDKSQDSSEHQSGNGEQTSEDDINASSDEQPDTSTEDITHNQTDGHADPKRSKYQDSISEVDIIASTSEISNPQSELPDHNGSDESKAEPLAVSTPKKDDKSNSSDVTDIDTSTEIDQTEGSNVAASKKDLMVKLDKVSVPAESSVKVDDEKADASSPTQSERWSLRPRRRKESSEEPKGSKRKSSDDDTEDEPKKSRGRRRSTDSNVSSGASEHSSVSRASGAEGSPRSRRGSEDGKTGTGRRVLRNTVKPIPEEEKAKPGRRASKNK